MPLKEIYEYMIKKKPEGFNNISLDNCFQNFQKDIIYTGENKFYCDNCKKYQIEQRGIKYLQVLKL